MRSPSVLSDSSVRLSRLRTTPAKNPRTECCCQPVAFMMAAIVAPSGCRNRPRTCSCLELERGLCCLAFLGAAGFVGLLVLAADLDFRARWVVGIPDSSHRLRRHPGPSPPKPRGGRMALAGRGV